MTLLATLMLLLVIALSFVLLGRCIEWFERRPKPNPVRVDDEQVGEVGLF